MTKIFGEKLDLKHVVIVVLGLAIVYFIYEHNGIKGAYMSLLSDVHQIDEKINPDMKAVKGKHCLVNGLFCTPKYTEPTDIDQGYISQYQQWCNQGDDGACDQLCDYVAKKKISLDKYPMCSARDRCDNDGDKGACNELCHTYDLSKYCDTLCELHDCDDCPTELVHTCRLNKLNGPRKGFMPGSTCTDSNGNRDTFCQQTLARDCFDHKGRERSSLTYGVVQHVISDCEDPDCLESTETRENCWNMSSSTPKSEEQKCKTRMGENQQKCVYNNTNSR